MLLFYATSSLTTGLNQGGSRASSLLVPTATRTHTKKRLLNATGGKKDAKVFGPSGTSDSTVGSSSKAVFFLFFFLTEAYGKARFD